MAKKIIITKKYQPKKKDKNNVKNIKTKLPIQQSKITKSNIKKTKINHLQRKKITKSPIIKKNSKKIIKPNPQPTKIIVKTKQKQDNRFIKILKLLINTILILLPIILIGGGLCLVIFKLFPEVAAQIGGGATKIWVFLKDICHNLDDKTKEWLENIGVNFKYSSIISKVLWFIGGFLLAGVFFFTPVIGSFLGKVVFFITIAYVTAVSLTDKPTPKTKTPPPNLVAVYNLDVIKVAEETKLKKELTEYSTQLQQEGKSSEEIEQKINEIIEKTKELKKKQLN